MKREILFRGKRIDNGEWVEGFYAQTDIGTFIVQYNVDCELEATLMTDYEVDPNTVCQYTGLTDKNGKKIFEGDIVDFEYDFAGLSRGFIIWNEDDARFEIDDDGFSAQFYETRQMEVIGTIFDKEE